MSGSPHFPYYLSVNKIVYECFNRPVAPLNLLANPGELGHHGCGKKHGLLCALLHFRRASPPEEILPPSLETCDGGILQPINHRWLFAGVSPQDVIQLRYRIKSLSLLPCEWSAAGPDGAVGLQGWFVLQLKFLGIQVAITLGAPRPWLKMYIFLKASGQDFRSFSNFPLGIGNNLRESFLFLVISKK